VTDVLLFHFTLHLFIFVFDRNLVNNSSWNDLNNQNLVTGKNIFIDNGTYKIKLLTGGQQFKIGLYGNFEASTTNEWDRIISGVYTLLP